MRTPRDDTLIVFLSDTHIGGDQGHDIFESPEELTALLEELSAHGGPVELVLAGDFFDFLEIGDVPNAENRASMTISRYEYRKLFSTLRAFSTGESHRVVYLPGNHDAEVWWNPAVQKTLREEGLVDEFALSYATRFESVPERIFYCEHGNQFDPANTIKDYEDPLDTPLGDHIVTDLTRGSWRRDATPGASICGTSTRSTRLRRSPSGWWDATSTTCSAGSLHTFCCR